MYLQKYKKFIGFSRKPPNAYGAKKNDRSSSVYKKGFICSLHPLAKISEADEASDMRLDDYRIS